VTLWLGGAAYLARRLRGGRSIVLAYHNIVPEGETVVGDRSLHLPVGVFREHLELIRRTYEVVPLAAILDRSSSDRPAVAISFDDAYRGALTAGRSALADMGVPATFFVVPGMVGKSFWWDEIPMTEALRAEMLDRHAGRDQVVRDQAAQLGIATQVTPEHACAATEDELREAMSTAGITLAPHTWSHPNLARLSGPDLRDELERPLEWLRSRFPAGRVLPLLAFPYGFSSEAARRTTKKVGYEAAFAVSGGWIPRLPCDRYALPRLNIPDGLSTEGFELRVAGAL
jgi:peptidoglycan/xylan/chitin deacetylase (PgdA/CDA1 family)